MMFGGVSAGEYLCVGRSVKVRVYGGWAKSFSDGKAFR